MVIDDDGFELQYKAVDEYHFEDEEQEPICFSVLPFQLDENKEVPSSDFAKKVYLSGLSDQGCKIYEKVVAWRIVFECEHPNISVLSGGNWIRLLKPRKSYAEDYSRSILITVQMLHFVRKHHRVTARLGRLWNHLDKVFNQFATRPLEDDLRKHHALIKLFVEEDKILMNSKILQRFIENGSIRIKKVVGTNLQFVGDELHKKDDDDDEDSQSSDGHSDNDDGADPICAICDDGGKLLSCKGKCKRAFHATKKHGRKSGCETLGYTSAQRKKIATFICINCKYNQHRCFKCGELDPSDEPNAKVFQCKSCGHFYHPKFVAKLLELGTTDRCELEERIMAGKPFTCPIHRCSKCQRKENWTKEARRLAVCIRCPRSYHIECLPRDISFAMNGEMGNDGVTTCAWGLPQITFFYCPDHIDKATNTVGRDHMNFPTIPEISKTRDLTKKVVKMNGKRKNNTEQHSMRSTGLSKRFCGKESDSSQSVATSHPFEQIVWKPECAAPEHVIETVCAANHLKEDMLLEPRVPVAAANCSVVQVVKCQKKESGTSHALGSHTEKSWVARTAGKGTMSRTSHDGFSNCVVGSTRSMYDSGQPFIMDGNGKSKNDEHAFLSSLSLWLWSCPEPTLEDMETAVTQHNHLRGEQNTSCVNQQLEKDAEWDNQNGGLLLSEDKDGNESRKTKQHFSGKEQGTPIKDTSHESNMLNDVFDNLAVERATKEHESDLQSRVMEGQESSFLHDPLSQQLAENSRREIRPLGDQCKEDRADLPEKQEHVSYVNNVSIKNRRQEFSCDENQEVSENRSCLEEPNSSQCNDNPKAEDIYTSFDKARMRRETMARCSDDEKADLGTNHPQVQSSYSRLANDKECNVMDSEVASPLCRDENTVAETYEDKCLEREASNKREKSVHNMKEYPYDLPFGGDALEKSRNHSRGQRSLDYHGSSPITGNQHRCEQQQLYHLNCSCIDYFSCRKFMPILDDYGNKFSGCHAMDIDPAIRCSLPGNSTSVFRAHTDISVGGNGAVYNGHDSKHGRTADSIFGWGPRAPVARSVMEKYAFNPLADLGSEQVSSSPSYKLQHH